MREAEKYEIKPMFVVVEIGELRSWTYSVQEALDAAQECVEQRVADHWKHKLPVQVTSDIARELDVRVYRCDVSSQVELPFQKWFDESHNHRVALAAEAEADDYKRYLELRSKYEERFQRESCRPLNCVDL